MSFKRFNDMGTNLEEEQEYLQPYHGLIPIKLSFKVKFLKPLKILKQYILSSTSYGLCENINLRTLQL